MRRLRLADGTRLGVPYAILEQRLIILHGVPEPAACALVLLGVAALLAGAEFARRHRVQ